MSIRHERALQESTEAIVARLTRRERCLARRDLLAAILMPVAVLVLWEIAARLTLIDVRLFPAPTSIVMAMAEMIVAGNLLEHVVVTVSRIAVGSLIGIVVGVGLGLAMGYYRLLGAALGPLLSSLYALPKIAIFPLLLVVFGLGETPRVLVVAISVFFVMQINTMSGVRHIDPRMLDAGTAFGATGWRRFRYVVLPAALPSIFAGLRVSAGVSILVIAAVEFVGSSNGLGFLIWNSWTLFQPTRMFVGLVVIALLGALLAGLVDAAERIASPWSAGPRRKRRANRAVVALGAIGLAVAFAACSPPAERSVDDQAAPGKTVTVKLAYVRSGLFAPLFVAMERGYFDDEGIVLEATELNTLQDAFPLLASGRLDAAIGGVSSGMFSAIDQGFDLEMVASIASSPGTTPAPTALIVRRDLIHSGKVRQIEDLAGRKIAAAGGASGGGGWNLMVMFGGTRLGIGDVTVVALGNPDMGNALRTGAVDAAVVTAPFSAAIVAEGIGAEFGNPLPRGYGAGALIYSAAFTESSGAQRFYDALAMGERDVATEGPTSDAIAEIIANGKYVGQDLEVVKRSPAYAYSLELFRPEVHARWFVALQRQSIDLGFLDIDRPIPMEQFVDTRFADNSKVKWHR